jgi:hypothetical protein
MTIRRIWRYQRGNQNPYIKKEQTTQWPQDTKGVIRIRISKKNRQHNGHKIPKVWSESDIQILITPLVSCDHWVVCSSLIYGFWLHLWYLLTIVLSVLLWYMDYDYTFGILWPLCGLFFFDIRKQTTQRPKERVSKLKDKQWSTKHTHKTKDRVTLTPPKSVNSFCSTSDTRRVNIVTHPVISHEWGNDREMFTESGSYPWSFVTQIFHSTLWTYHLYVATFQQHLHMEYISLSWYTISELQNLCFLSELQWCFVLNRPSLSILW